MPVPTFDHPSGRAVKLGKKPPKVDHRTLKLEKYVDSLPAPPPDCDNTKGVTEWGEMLNDQLGDCCIAAEGHGTQIATLNSTIGEIAPPDTLIQDIYSQACGYVPGDPSTDNGCFILDVLNYVRKAQPGTHLHQHKHKFMLYAFAGINPSNIANVMRGIQLFGVVDMGVNLPATAQGQLGGLWDVVGDPNHDSGSKPGSWGGHCAAVVKYRQDPTHGLILTCITWGELQDLTLRFWNAYVDEAYALLYRAWLQQFGELFPEKLSMFEYDLSMVTR